MGDIKDAAKIYSKSAEKMHNKYVDGYLKPRDAWQMLLSTIIGVYAMIEQHNLFKEQIKIAKRVMEQQEEYLTLAKRTYNEIMLPTHMRQRDRFDRFVNQFQDYETRYMTDAFRLKEYSPEYTVQEGRTLASVQTQFDRAAKMKRRMCGKYNYGRACDDATRFAIMTALAKVDAVNHGYRFEEARKRALDEWYWQRRTAGAHFTENMRANVISGLNQGTAVVGQGLNAVGNAYSNLIKAEGPLAAAYANMGNFWGSLANGAFRLAGYGMGRMSVSPFGMGRGTGGTGFGFQAMGQGVQGNSYGGSNLAGSNLAAEHTQGIISNPALNQQSAGGYRSSDAPRVKYTTGNWSGAPALGEGGSGYSGA